MARVAACFAGFEAGPARSGPSGRDDDTTVVRVPPIPLASRTASSTSRTPTSPAFRSGRRRERASRTRAARWKAGRPPGRPPRQPRQREIGRAGAPVISGSEWAWGDHHATARRSRSNDAVPASHPMPSKRRDRRWRSLSPTRSTRSSWNRARFAGRRPIGGGGILQPRLLHASGPELVLSAIFHPNDLGYAGEAAGLVAEADRLGIAVVR